MCEKLFVDTYRRENSGRFVVKLPFLHNPPELGDSLSIAIKRFQFLEKRFEKDPLLKTKYIEFMKDYETKGHMIKISDSKQLSLKSAFYLPHHGIFQQSVNKVKLRVVFDASAKSSNNRSLNDELLTGNNLQNDIRRILIRFRQHRFVFISDVEQMYRQILVDAEDTHFQRIVWREHLDQKLYHFCLLTLTYGTVCAPFLAIRVLRELANIEKIRFPDASKVLSRDTYIWMISLQVEKLWKKLLL